MAAASMAWDLALRSAEDKRSKFMRIMDSGLAITDRLLGTVAQEI